MNKLVSIILPTYNGSKWIEKAIRSVLFQSYIEWELIVIDDGSQDNTAQIVASLTQKDIRIRYIKNKENLGIQKTLNCGLKEAKGEYIARIDDDDEWVDIDKLKKQVEFLETNKDHVLIGTGAILINEDGFELCRFLLPSNDLDIRKKILSKNCFIHSSVMFKKDSALNLNGYIEEKKFLHIEDYNLWLRLGTIGKFANLRSYSVSLMQRDDTLSNYNRIDQTKKTIKQILKFSKVYPNFIFGYILSICRLIFFLIKKYLPINDTFLNKIKNKYKENW